MKKILFIILLSLFLIPFNTYASSVSIKDVSISDKSDNSIVLEDASWDGLKINFNLSFMDVDDFILYKVVLKNDSNKDYQISTDGISSKNSKYILYNYHFEDNSNIIKSGEEKILFITIKYVSLVEFSNNDNYIENNTMKIELLDEDNKIVNPNTGRSIMLLFMIIFFTVGIALSVVYNKSRTNILLFSLLLVVPVSVYAIEKISIDINSHVEVVNPEVVPTFKSFSDDDWATIVSKVKSGIIPSYYTVGSTKEVDMGDFGIHTLRIANVSNPSECESTGFSQTACGFVLEFSDIITTHNMNPSGEYKGITYNNGWNVDGWPASSMRDYVNNTIYNALPTELKNGICDTTVISSHGSTAGEENFTSTDKIYLLSLHEIFQNGDSNTVTGIDYYDTAYNNTRQLDYYSNLGVTPTNYRGANKGYVWWLRSAISNSRFHFIDVDAIGRWHNLYSSGAFGVSPAFRIG